jgi:hypothetical protein
MLEQCRANFGPAGPQGRKLTMGEYTGHLQVLRPRWCEASDPLSELFRDWKRLILTGQVTWGATVQANELLFDAGPLDHPAEAVYPADLGSQARLAELARAAQACYDLKEQTVDDPELQAVADHLTDEMTRVFGRPVPRSLSPDLPCETTTFLVVRRHIPRRKLCGPFFPLLVTPRPPRLATILPARYWPPELVRWWEAECPVGGARQ